MYTCQWVYSLRGCIIKNRFIRYQNLCAIHISGLSCASVYHAVSQSVIFSLYNMNRIRLQIKKDWTVYVLLVYSVIGDFNIDKNNIMTA